jgi:hypothetical protein
MTIHSLDHFHGSDHRGAEHEYPGDEAIQGWTLAVMSLIGPMLAAGAISAVAYFG